ncbi:MAG: hypothetical protein Q9169_005453 [Polycauliona sp. 2 TL-2023]
MAKTQSSLKESSVALGGNAALDEGVIAVLPPGSQVLKASSFGTSAWTNTACIKVQLLNGSTKKYFLKYATEDGQIMMEGEFSSMTELHKLAPSFVPRPLAWGRFHVVTPVTHFFLCDFIDMAKQMPNPVPFCAQLAQIHRNSQSPTGQFGFRVPNCHGKIVQSNDWDPSWAAYFTKMLAFQTVVETVIPQLLEPLQASGRTLKPSLVHGDLWEGNAAVELSTGTPVVFDASAFYAHNEYDLGTWRRESVQFSQPYFDEYRKNIPASEPAEQWDDRVRLYSLKFNLAHVIGWKKALVVRQEIYNDMLYLIEKYPDRAKESA